MHIFASCGPFGTFTLASCIFGFIIQSAYDDVTWLLHQLGSFGLLRTLPRRMSWFSAPEARPLIHWDNRLCAFKESMFAATVDAYRITFAFAFATALATLRVHHNAGDKVTFAQAQACCLPVHGHELIIVEAAAERPLAVEEGNGADRPRRARL